MKRSEKGFLTRLRAIALLKRFRKNEDGATAVEFAFVGGPFILLIFSIIESSLFFFAGQVLESSVDSVGRQIRTGQMQNTTEANFKAKVCSETAVLFECARLKTDMKVVATFDDLTKAPPNVPTDFSIPVPGFGFVSPCAEEIAQITVYYDWPIITNYVQTYLSKLDNGNALLSAIAIFKTEPFIETGACAVT